MHSKPWGWNVVESAKWTSWKQLANMPVRSSQLPSLPRAALTASHTSLSPPRCSFTTVLKSGWYGAGWFPVGRMVLTA
jgi:hypothetical protein